MVTTTTRSGQVAKALNSVMATARGVILALVMASSSTFTQQLHLTNIRVSQPNMGGLDDRHNESWVPIADVGIYNLPMDHPTILFCISINTVDVGCHAGSLTVRYNGLLSSAHANNTCSLALRSGEKRIQLATIVLLNAAHDILVTTPDVDSIDSNTPKVLHIFEIRKGNIVFADGASSIPVFADLAPAHKIRGDQYLLQLCAQIDSNPVGCASFSQQPVNLGIFLRCLFLIDYDVFSFLDHYQTSICHEEGTSYRPGCSYQMGIA